MSLPVPSPYGAQLLLTLWLGFLLVAVLGYGLLRWWHLRKGKAPPKRIDHSKKAKRTPKRKRAGR